MGLFQMFQCLKRNYRYFSNCFQFNVVYQCKQVLYVSEYYCVVELGELVSEKIFANTVSNTLNAIINIAQTMNVAKYSGYVQPFPGAHIELSIL